MQKKNEASSEKLYGLTGTAFNFTAGDLQANRAGFITQRQKMVQESIIFQELLADISIFILTLFVPISVNIIFIATPFSLAQNLNNWPLALITGLLAISLDLLWLWLLQGVISGYSRLKRDIKESVVEKILGTIKVQSNKNNEFSLKIENACFPINSAQAELLASLKDNTICVVYTMPHSKRILAIEEAAPAAKAQIIEENHLEEEGVRDAKEKRTAP